MNNENEVKITDLTFVVSSQFCPLCSSNTFGNNRATMSSGKIKCSGCEHEWESPASIAPLSIEWEFESWAEKATYYAFLNGFDKAGNEYTAIGIRDGDSFENIHDVELKPKTISKEFYCDAPEAAGHCEHFKERFCQNVGTCNRKHPEN